ncbi:TetR-like C-terminal domain-containing protein [Actinoallomurus soli]|uniref:TetR-like C-terminal domain-containing protein n=1 Tax=Actinoallomurus soli TaxID=2952535 RepID=UPI0020934B5E|nr:WHG domain-containing protein [Actinoallomurus soli]MCO5967773.1 WHG domain-containing protein [Actinoallomurus soli]
MSAQDPAAEAHPRDRLLSAALRLLAADGPEALQARRLTAEVGLSTMAVYTHFGGMGGLITEVVREGFARFDRRLEAAPRSDDPVVDLLALGLAYRDHALANPQLYRLMFGVIPPVGRQNGKDLVASSVGNDLPEGQTAFGRLVTAVTRVMEASGACEEKPDAAAAQIWSAIHGYVLLEIAGFFDGDDDPVECHLLPLGTKLAVGIGAAPDHAARCAHRIAASRREPVPEA